MDPQILRVLEDSPVQLCSYSKVISNPTWTTKAEEVREDTGHVPSFDTTQTQTAVTGSYVTQMEPVPNSDSCSSAEAKLDEPETRSRKRYRSTGSGSLQSLEAFKRQRYGVSTGSICESSQDKACHNTSVAVAVSGVSQISPSRDEVGSCSNYSTDGSSEKFLTSETILPQTKAWAQNVEPSSSSSNTHPSHIKSLPEPLPRRRIDFTVEDLEAPRRTHIFEDFQLPPLASPLGSSTDSAPSEKISLSPIKDLLEDLDDPFIHSASLRQSFCQSTLREPTFPEILETRRWGFAKGSDSTTQVLVAGDWHPGPVLKPFDNAYYEDNALE